MTEIKKERPPNYEAIKRVFPGASRPGVIFAYAPFIYAPYVDPVPPELIAHEEVHIARQQIIGVDRWWSAYLANETFRYVEELLAHRAEYQYLAKLSRQVRRSALKTIAGKLSAELYGGMVPLAHAMHQLQAEVIEGCFACHGLGVALTKEGVECGKCEGLGYLEGEVAA